MKFKLQIDPSSEEELILRMKADCDFVGKIEELVLSYNCKDSITVFSEGELIVLTFSEIECFTVVDRKTFVVTTEGKKYRISHTLSAIAKLLPSNFIRINKSSLANERHIKCFKTLFSGAVDAVFKSGYRDYVSRRCFADIKRRYKNEKQF